MKNMIYPIRYILFIIFLVGGYNIHAQQKNEPLKHEKAKNQFIYNTALVSEQAASHFFFLAMAQAEFDLAKKEVGASAALYNIGQQRHSIAAISRASLLTLKLDNANAEIALKGSMFSLATSLNSDSNAQIEVELPSTPQNLCHCQKSLIIQSPDIN